MSTSRAVSVLVPVLTGLRFPADRWQVLAHVDHYGADPGTRHLFWALPERSYPNAAAVLAELGVPPAGRPSGQPTHPGAAPPTGTPRPGVPDAVIG